MDGNIITDQYDTNNEETMKRDIEYMGEHTLETTNTEEK